MKIKIHKKRRERWTDGRRYRRGRNSYGCSLIVKYRVSVFSAPQPETALIFKAFPWKQLPESQFKADLYPATFLPSPLFFSLCQVFPSFLLSSLFVPSPLPLPSFPPSHSSPSPLPFCTSLALKFSLFVFSLFISCPLFSSWSPPPTASLC